MELKTVADVRTVLGAKLATYAIGLDSTADLRALVEDRAPSNVYTADVRQRIAALCDVVARVTSRDTSQVAQAWLMGENDSLNNSAPASMLRHAVGQAQIVHVRDQIVAAVCSNLQ